MSASLYNNLAWVAMLMGNLDESLKWYQMSLAITRSAMGADHPETASHHILTGDVLAKMGRFHEAQAEYYEAWLIRQVSVGLDDEATRVAGALVAIAYFSKVFRCCRPCLHNNLGPSTSE